MGASSSVAASQQTAEAFLSQQFYGSCDISCTNRQENVNVALINSVLDGDINLTQKCSTNGNCMISSSADATSSVLFKAGNSSNAKNASNLFSGSILNFDSSVAQTNQDIKQTILQNTTEKCNVSTLNEMDDINILAENSKIGGDINLSQSGNAKGKCQLGNSFSAAAAATGMATDKATSGKDKKGQKFGDKAGLGSVLGFIIVIVIIFVLARMFTQSQKASAVEESSKKIAEARAKAGCAYGEPIKVDGKVVFGPDMKPICPVVPEGVKSTRKTSPHIQDTSL